MKFIYLMVILLLLVSIVLAQGDIAPACNDTQCDATCIKCIDGKCHDPGFVCESAAPICTNIQCDPGCVKCSDGKCHETTFICRERVALSDLFPTEIDLGDTEITVLLSNNGNVDLRNVHAEVKGDGITLLDAESIPKLNIDEEDYATIKISAAKTGKITLLVKFFVDSNQLDEKQTEDITVKGVPVIQYNKTELEDKLTEIKQEYLNIEQEYQDKKLGGYLVDLITDNIEYLGSSINNARDALLEEDYKKATLNLDKATSLINDIKDQLSKVKKKEEQFGNKLKGYLIYAGSIAAAIISILTAWKLTTSHINKENLKRLHEKQKKSFATVKKSFKREEKKKKKKATPKLK